MQLNSFLITILLLCSKLINSKLILNTLQLQYKTFLEGPSKIILCTGPAGTGKTMLACYEAIRQLKEQNINKIIITRPLVSVEENLGFLPGTIEEKTYPFMIPVYDYFMEYYSKDQIATLIKNGKLEIAPLAFMRGRTFKDTYVLADEMQNSSKNQMQMLLTRLGSNSKLVITGDLDQNDILEENGLKNFIELLEKYYPSEDERFYNGFAYCKLDNSCIKRNKIIEKVLNIYKAL